MNEALSEWDGSSCRTDDDFLFSFAVLGDSRLSCGWSEIADSYPHDFIHNLGDKLANWRPRLAFVVFSGDMATYPIPYLPHQLTTQSEKHLDNWFGSFGGPLVYYGISLYPVMGNHETYFPVPLTPGKYYSKAAIYSLGTFQHQMVKHSVDHTIIDGEGNYFWDWPKDSPNSRFFVISWYDEYYKDNSGLITDSCIKALKTYMEDARSKNIKNIFVMGHVPIPDKPSPTGTPANTNALIDLLYEYDVRAYFAGHRHLYFHRNIYTFRQEQPAFGNEIVLGAAGADIGSSKGN